MRIEAQRLISQAARDLLNAGKNVEVHACGVAAFLARQATEKYLEAAWIVLKEEFDRKTSELGIVGASRQQGVDLLAAASVAAAARDDQAVPADLPVEATTAWRSLPGKLRWIRQVSPRPAIRSPARIVASLC